MFAGVLDALKVPCSRRPRVGGEIGRPRLEAYAALILPERRMFRASLVNWWRQIRRMLARAFGATPVAVGSNEVGGCRAAALTAEAARKVHP